MNEQNKPIAEVVVPAANLTDPPEYLVDFVGSMPVTRSENSEFVNSPVAPMREKK